MNVGAAQLDITPEPGIDLAGFALRPQPSGSVLDRLALRALYLQDGPERFLWLHADLLALEQALADRWRGWIESSLGIARSHVLISTTHTHSGPATIQLTGCGEVQPQYVTWLEDQVHQLARHAVRDTEPCGFLSVEGACHLGQDRRASASAHTDPRVGVLAWQRRDGSYKAVFLDYAMHPVCLRSDVISADWPGAAARHLSESLPGRPLVLVASGACGNINPPGVGVTPDQMRSWGRQVSATVLPRLLDAADHPAPASNGRPLTVTSASLSLPLEPWTIREIDSYAAACLADTAGEREFNGKFSTAVETWRATLIDRCRRGEPAQTWAELTVLFLGETVLVTANAEVFSRFNELTAAATPQRVYTVGCANGMIGYLPTSEAYAEGAYEVLWSMLFYNMPRPRQGGLELLADRARSLIRMRGEGYRGQD